MLRSSHVRRGMWLGAATASVAAVALLSIGHAAGAADGSIIVRNPEAPSTAQGSLVALPQLVPPGVNGYAQHQLDKSVAAPDGRPVAQLGDGRDVQQAAVYFPPQKAPAATEISYAVLSSIRYTIGGRTVFVTTARPSPAARQQTHLLGSRTVRLADGAQAWTATGLPGGTPNQVVTLQNDLIVTVAGDLPVDALNALAARLSVRS